MSAAQTVVSLIAVLEDINRLSSRLDAKEGTRYLSVTYQNASSHYKTLVEVLGPKPEFLKVPVHRLVLDHRKYLIVGEWEVFVFLKNLPGNSVQINRNTIRGLDSCYLDMVFLNIILSEIVGIGMPKSRETAKEKHIPDGFQVRKTGWNLQMLDPLKFGFGEIYDFFLRGLQSRTETLIGQIGVIAMLCRPV